MLPTNLKEALLRMNQLPKLEHRLHEEVKTWEKRKRTGFERGWKARR